jgi:hypothetical protein
LNFINYRIPNRSHTPHCTQQDYTPCYITCHPMVALFSTPSQITLYFRPTPHIAPNPKYHPIWHSIQYCIPTRYYNPHYSPYHTPSNITSHITCNITSNITPQLNLAKTTNRPTPLLIRSCGKYMNQMSLPAFGLASICPYAPLRYQVVRSHMLRPRRTQMAQTIDTRF